MDDEEYDFEHSLLFGLFTRNGHMVEVESYHLACTDVARKPTFRFAPIPVIPGTSDAPPLQTSV